MNENQSNILFNDLFVESSKYQGNVLEDIEIEKFKDMSVTHGNVIRLFRHFVKNREDVVRPLRPCTTEISYFTDKEDKKDVKGLRYFYGELRLSDPCIYKILKVCSVPCENLKLSKYNLRKIKKKHNLKVIYKSLYKKPIIRPRIIKLAPVTPKVSQCYVVLNPLDKVQKFSQCEEIDKGDFVSNINIEEYTSVSSPSVTSESECSFTKSSLGESSTMSSDIFMRIPIVI